MKKIINGKKYDTETASELGFKQFTQGGAYESEIALYRKKTGEFFKVVARVGNDDEIIPLTIADAKKTAENILSVEKYEEIFGAVEE